MGKESKKLTADNKKARLDYFILETFETGIELFGTEVKALRMGHCPVKKNWVGIRNGEILIYGVHINPYEKGNTFDRDPPRVRKLLIHRSEIRRLISTIRKKGLALVPLEIYLKGRPVKVEIDLAQGKKKYDKRTTIAESDTRRDLERNFRESVRY